MWSAVAHKILGKGLFKDGAFGEFSTGAGNFANGSGEADLIHLFVIDDAFLNSGADEESEDFVG